MKNLPKIKTKLIDVLRESNHKDLLSDAPWSDQRFFEVVSILKVRLIEDDEVINENPINLWFEEYSFFMDEVRFTGIE